MLKKLKLPRPNKGVLPRALADILFLNVSLAAALLLRFLAAIFGEGRGAQLAELANIFAGFYYLGSPLLTALGLLVFDGFGVYHRTRFYARKHKALVLFQAITTTYLVFIFTLYFLAREITLIPRSVFVLSYAATLALSGGTRLIKHFASQRYDLVQRRPPAGREIRQVLVVGGAGYIGSVLVRQLLDQNYQVRVLDAGLFGHQSLQGIRTHPGFEWIEGDLRHVEAVVRAVKGRDAVIHLGAIVGDPACQLDGQSAREINTIATKMLVQVCRGYGVQRLLFASTCAVYGASDHLLDERSALHPVSLYAQSKADAETVVLEAKSQDFCPVVLRLGTAFGHSYRPRFDLVVNLLVAKAWKDRQITIYNPEQWRPFIHVHDIARAFVQCLQARPEVVRGEIFNVGSYLLNATLGQLAEKIKACVPNPQVDYLATEDRRNYRVSFDKIHTSLGFCCEKRLEDGILEMIEYLQKEPTEVLKADDFDNSERLKALTSSWLASGSALALEPLIEVAKTTVAAASPTGNSPGTQPPARASLASSK